jgi:hypothetical protein
MTAPFDRAPVDVAVDRLTRVLAGQGRMWPRLCAAVIVARAVLQLDRDAFASRVGLSVGSVRALEDGGCAPLLAPGLLPDLVPAIDWQAAGVAVPRAPRHPHARRHPSAYRGAPRARLPPAGDNGHDCAHR